MNCSNGCDKEAKKEVPITGQKVCQVCWEEKNYFPVIKALKVFASMKLYGRTLYEAIRFPFGSSASITEHRLGIQTGPDDKALTFEEIDWTLFKTLTLLPDVQRIKTKLMEKGVEFSTKYYPKQEDSPEQWDAKIRYKFNLITRVGKTEEEALFLAIHTFHESGGKLD